MRIPVIRDHAKRGEQQRQQRGAHGEGDEDERRDELPARFAQLDAGERCTRGEEVDRTRSQPRTRRLDGRRLDTGRPAGARVRRLARTRAGRVGAQRRLVRTPAMKPIAAATPITGHGFV